jgi:hypothetical protein
MGTTVLPPGSTIGGHLLDWGLEVTTAPTLGSAGFHWGILVASETVAGEVESPFVDPHADWMAYGFVSLAGAAVGDRLSTFDALGGPWRVRSKRRMEEIGERCWFVVEPLDVAFDARFVISTLVILP